jgi:hypothetical protein
MVPLARTWPVTASPVDGLPERALVADLRALHPSGGEEVLAALSDLARFLTRGFAALGPSDGPAALLVRNRPAASGRVSDSLFGEMAVVACRGFVRQLRYDRSWTDVPLVFADARDAPDEELAPLVTAALHGSSAVELDRSSGRHAAFGWERGDGL